MKWILVLLALFSFTVSAADVTGTWKGSAETPNGTIERTFVFKQSGDKVTGETTSSFMGKSTIMDGKISGDDLSFHITVQFQGNEMKLSYKGKVSGNEIKFAVEGPGGNPALEYTAKKIS
jgi:hypothetical protein